MLNKIIIIGILLILSAQPSNAQIGVIALPEGSATAPALTFINDTRTGIYHSGIGSIAFTSLGVVIWDLNSSGFNPAVPININQGVIANNLPALSSIVTWNNAAITFTHWKANVTDTASASDSLLLDLQVGGVSKFSVSKIGEVLASTSFQAPVIGNANTALVLSTSKNPAALVNDGDVGVECTGASPNRICAIKINDGGTVKTIAFRVD